MALLQARRHVGPLGIHPRRGAGEGAGQDLDFPFLALNMRDTEWNEPVFEPMKMFERGGVKIAVLGQAFPYTPVANPRWMMPDWSFGIREDDVRTQVDKARKAGADLVVLLSHNGFDVDRKLAARGAGHRRDSHRPHPRRAARGDPGRQDAAGRLRQPRQIRLAPRSRRKAATVKGLSLQADSNFADAIAPDAEMAAAIADGARASCATVARASDMPTRCSTGAAISTARSTT